MAITVAAAGTAISTTSSASLAITTTAAMAVGDWIVVCISADNTGGGGSSSTDGVVDASGHTYDLRSDWLRDPGAAAAGISLRVYTTRCTTPLAAGAAAITVNFSPNTTAKAAAVWRVTPTSGSWQIGFVTETGTTANSANPTITSASVTAGDLVIGVTAAETPVTPTADADTSNGTWSTAQVASANTGTGLTSAVCSSQYKVVTGTATQTYNTTLAALDHAIAILTFTEIYTPSVGVLTTAAAVMPVVTTASLAAAEASPRQLHVSRSARARMTR